MTKTEILRQSAAASTGRPRDELRQVAAVQQAAGGTVARLARRLSELRGAQDAQRVAVLAALKRQEYLLYLVAGMCVLDLLAKIL